MRKNVLSILLIATLAVTLAVPVAAGPSGQKGPPPKAKGPAVRSAVSVEGVITAINEGRSSFTMRVLTPGHQRQVGADTMTVQVQSGTDIKIARRGAAELERPARIRDFRVGDRVHVEAFRLDNGQFLALRIRVQNRQVDEGEAGGRSAITQGGAVQTQGVVVAKGDRSLTVLQLNGSARTVLVTSATDITGRVTSFRAIDINDVVRVQGTVNADGSIAAQRIDVVFADGTRVTGTIALKSSAGPRFLVLSNGQAISISDITQIYSGGRVRSFDDLRVGMTITAVGSPIVVAGLTVGINARVITY